MELKSFQSALNADAATLKQSRVANFCKNAKDDALSLIQAKEREIRTLEDSLTSMMDLGEDTTMSIASKIKNVDTNALMTNIYITRINIENAQRDLNVMKDTYDKLFPSVTE